MDYAIKEFAAQTGLSPFTLRYYEKEKLLASKRAGNGWRYYTEKDVAWVLFLRRLKATGMPIRRIREYARLREQGNSTLQQRMQMLQEHHKFVLEQLAGWQENLMKLEDKIGYYANAIKSCEGLEPE